MYMNDIKLFSNTKTKNWRLLKTIRLFDLDIGTKFGIEKCVMLIMKTGKRQIIEVIELPNQERIRTQGEKENSKYLGKLESDSIIQAEMKEKNQSTSDQCEIPPEVWKTRQFDDILLRHCNAVYNQNPIDRWMKGCILPFPKKGDLGLAKNYRGITLTSIATKIYNALLRNRIEPKIDNILKKTKMASEEIDPRPHKY